MVSRRHHFAKKMATHIHHFAENGVRLAHILYESWLFGVFGSGHAANFLWPRFESYIRGIHHVTMIYILHTYVRHTPSFPSPPAWPWSCPPPVSAPASAQQAPALLTAVDSSSPSAHRQALDEGWEGRGGGGEGEGVIVCENGRITTKMRS